MKRFVLMILFLCVSTLAAAESARYYCEGETTSTMGDGPHVEETDTKKYNFVGGEIDFFSEKIKCDISAKSISCQSKKFNRTLSINKVTGYSTDTYEILKNGNAHAKIEFIGLCELY